LTNEIIDPDRLFSFFADKIICNSQAIARRFLENGHLPKKVVVVYNGVDTHKFNPAVSGAKIREEFGIKPEDIVIGIASRFNILKGHEIFLRAAKETLQSLPEMKDRLRFMVVGGAVFNQDSRREEYLKDRVNKLGLNSNLIFSGFRTDMPEMYAAMDIVVLASAAEPCGRVILEAMAMAKPLIGTNSGGTPEIIQDGVTGYLFSPQDYTGLAEKIIFLINHRDIAAKIGQSGRSHIEADFTIEANAGKIQDIYLELIRQTYA
jgi:glycosyltransferase involved in cell wall biosynthesis